jgi:uncharacterized membrane protein YhaH (DUF805 family)
MEWAILPLRRYAEFKGRSRRKEYWSFVLLTVAVFAALYFLEGLLHLSVRGQGPLTFLFQLAILLPMLAVGVRRLHDTGRSGWWLLIGYGPLLVSTLLPFVEPANDSLAMILLIVAGVGFIVLLILMALEGAKGSNAYGPDPKAGEGATPGAT